MVTVRVCSKLKTSWKSVVLTNKVGKISRYFAGVFDKTIIPFEVVGYEIIGSLSKDVFERRTSTGSEVFSLFIFLDTTKFVLLSFFSPIKTIYLRVSTKPQPNAAKSPLPVDVRRSKTLLLKLPNLLMTPRMSITSHARTALIIRFYLFLLIYLFCHSCISYINSERLK